MKIILGVAAAVALFIPGGQAFAVGVFTSLGASAAVAVALTTAFGWALVGVVINSVASVFTQEKPVTGNRATEQRLNKSIVPESPRKIVFGQTAAPLDVRYWEAFGSDNNAYDEVIAVATHEIESFEAFHLEDQLHTFDGSGHSNILGSAFQRFTKTVGVSGTSLNVGTGTKWTANSSMTGCAFFMLHYFYSQEDWPRSFPTRMTQEVKGAKVYDPRLDSTNGGVGTHRIDDQATWEYNDGTTDIGRNPALQMLWYLIGWRINGTLVAGLGVDINSISLQGFVQAANDVEAAGYNCDCVLSTTDRHEANIGMIESSCGGRLLDTGGIYTMHVAIDDTANIAVAFSEDDIVGAFEWVPSKKMRDQVNEITGKYVSPDALYQFRPMPAVSNSSYTISDGYTRRSNNVYASVQDPSQAQDLARIQLNKTRYQGVFKAPFNYKALQAKNWSIVTLSLEHYGWVDKLFRIIGYGVTTNGIIILTLQETDSSIYTVEAATPVDLPGIGTAFDPRVKIAVAGLTVVAQAVEGGGDTAQDGLLISFTAPSSIIDYTEVMYKVSTDTDYILAPSMPKGENSVLIAPLNALTSYDVRARHVTVEGVRGDWNQASATDTGNFSAVAWSSIGGTGTPADNADVTDYADSRIDNKMLTTSGVITDTEFRKSLANGLGQWWSSGTGISIVDSVGYGGGPVLRFTAQTATMTTRSLAPEEYVSIRTGDILIVKVRARQSVGGDATGIDWRAEFFQRDATGTSKGWPDIITASDIPNDGLWHEYEKKIEITDADVVEAAFYLYASSGFTTGTIDVDFYGVLIMPRRSDNDAVSFPDLTILASTGVEVRGNNLEKVSGVEDWNATNAYSKESVVGSARVSFQAGTITDAFMAGLNIDPTGGNGYAYLSHVWYPKTDGSAVIYEKGTLIDPSETYTISTIFSVIWDGVSVKYYMDGVLKYTSLNPPAANARVHFDSQINTIGSLVNSIAFGQGPTIQSMPNLVLVNDVGVEATGNYLKKTLNTAAWDSSAYSNTGFIGAAQISFKPANTAVNYVAGLNDDPSASSNYTDIPYGWYVRTDNTVRALENGATVYTGGAYTTDTLLGIIWDGVSVKYYVDNVLVHTSTAPPSPTAQLFFDSSFFTVGGALKDLVFGQGPTQTAEWDGVSNAPISDNHMNKDAYFTGITGAWFNDNNEIAEVTDDTEFVFTTEASSPAGGNTILKGTSTDDVSDDFFSERMPVDPTKTYKIGCWVRQPSGTKRNYLLVSFHDDTDTTISNSSSPVSDAVGWGIIGTYHYYSVVNVAFPTAWTYYEIIIGPDQAITLPSNAVSVQLGALVMRDVFTASVVEFAYMGIQEISMADTDQIVDAAVTDTLNSTATALSITNKTFTVYAAWFLTEIYATNDYVQNAGNVYRANAIINTNISPWDVAPTHTSGTINNWVWIEAYDTTPDAMQDVVTVTQAMILGVAYQLNFETSITNTMFSWDIVRTNNSDAVLETFDSGSGAPPTSWFTSKLAATSNTEKFKLRCLANSAGAVPTVTSDLVFNQWKK